MQQVVAAVARGGAGHLAFVFRDEAEGLPQQRQEFGGRVVPAHQQVAAGQAAHRTEIDDAVRPDGVVAQEGGGQVLDGVDGALAQGRLAVGLLHPEVEGGDHLAADGVLTGHVHAAQQLLVVDGKARYLVHYSLSINNFRKEKESSATFCQKSW